MKWRFAQDYDSHWYLFPESMSKEFADWLDYQERLWDSSLDDDAFEKIKKQGLHIKDFNDYRSDSPMCYRIENPERV